VNPAVKLALSALVTGSVALAAGGLTYSAFSSTTSNNGNSLQVGSVHLSDNDLGSALVSLSGAVPGDAASGCILITYGGTLNAQVRLYAAVSGALAPYLDVKIWRGIDASPSFPACTGFVADLTDYIGAGPGVIYAGTLANLPSSFTSGIHDPASTGGDETWTTSEQHSYKVTATLKNDPNAAGLSASADLIWEARNL
jgi:hypothetical protein